MSFDQFPEPESLRKAFLTGYLSVRQLPTNFSIENRAFMTERRLRLLRWVATWPSVNYYPFGKKLIENSLNYLNLSL